VVEKEPLEVGGVGQQPLHPSASWTNAGGVHGGQDREWFVWNQTRSLARRAMEQSKIGTLNLN